MAVNDLIWRCGNCGGNNHCNGRDAHCECPCVSAARLSGQNLVMSAGQTSRYRGWTCGDCPASHFAFGISWLEARKGAFDHVQKAGHVVTVTEYRGEVLYPMRTQARED